MVPASCVLVGGVCPLSLCHQRQSVRLTSAATVETATSSFAFSWNVADFLPSPRWTPEPPSTFGRGRKERYLLPPLFQREQTALHLGEKPNVISKAEMLFLAGNRWLRLTGGQESGDGKVALCVSQVLEWPVTAFRSGFISFLGLSCHPAPTGGGKQ